MKKLIIIILLVFTVAAFAAIDSVAERKSAQIYVLAPTPPIPDGTISANDRAALAGIYMSSTAAGRYGGTFRNYRRSRYK